VQLQSIALALLGVGAFVPNQTMPPSKRSTAVSLTRVRPGGASAGAGGRPAAKASLVARLRASLPGGGGGARAFPTAVVFAYDNMRSAAFKALRASPEWADSQWFLGKNRLMERALSEAAAEGGAAAAGLAALSSDLLGQVGLLLTRRPLAAALAGCAAVAVSDWARAGWTAPPGGGVTLAPGPLPAVPHSSAEWLTRLGLRLRLDHGAVHLEAPAVLAAPGVPITPEQGRLLQFFGHRLAIFRLRPLSAFAAGGYKSLVGAEAPGAAVPPHPPRRRNKERKPAPAPRRGRRASAAGGGGEGEVEEEVDEDDDDDDDDGGEEEEEDGDEMDDDE